MTKPSFQFFLLLSALLLGLPSPAPLRGEEDAAPSQEAPAEETSAPAEEEDPLDVTVTGEAQDEIPIAKTPAPTEVPFRDIVSLSRQGELERVLNDSIQHMTNAQQIELVKHKSEQTVDPLIVSIPKPPFFKMEVPIQNDPYLWELQIVDHNNKIIKTLQGTTLPDDFFVWDGYGEGGVIKIRPGPAYSPILEITNSAGEKQSYFGTPVQWDTLQYKQDGLLHIEFLNERLYERGSTQFSQDMMPVIKKCMDMMKERMGTPFRVIIHTSAGKRPLAKRRSDYWDAFLKEELLLDTEELLTLAVQQPKGRGEVTTLMMLAEP